MILLTGKKYSEAIIPLIVQISKTKDEGSMRL
jgi:hypothetical protein